MERCLRRWHIRQFRRRAIRLESGDPFDDISQLFTQLIQRPVAPAFLTVVGASAGVEDIEVPSIIETERAALYNQLVGAWARLAEPS